MIRDSKNERVEVWNELTVLLFGFFPAPIGHLGVSGGCLIHIGAVILLMLLEALIELFNDCAAFGAITHGCRACSAPSHTKTCTIGQMHFESLRLLRLLLASNEGSPDYLTILLAIVRACIDMILFRVLRQK